MDSEFEDFKGNDISCIGKHLHVQMLTFTLSIVYKWYGNDG